MFVNNLKAFTKSSSSLALYSGIFFPLLEYFLGVKYITVHYPFSFCLLCMSFTFNIFLLFGVCYLLCDYLHRSVRLVLKSDKSTGTFFS